ncbi:hypothetical protein OVY29_05285 [Sphingopyxis sp. SE2]|uniref:hypothetical protein n=1 Tax=Sphingopyxis sp. SE2 TaxID=1586240 RepID=UPI0028C09243|nr:hypothetical protein [Sphingopyxis sp. SE2]MDT7528072.1 hypothetical protein [Sphingopyxis sp. SE2]
MFPARRERHIVAFVEQSATPIGTSSPSPRIISDLPFEGMLVKASMLFDDIAAFRGCEHDVQLAPCPASSSGSGRTVEIVCPARVAAGADHRAVGVAGLPSAGAILHAIDLPAVEKKRTGCASR